MRRVLSEAVWGCNDCGSTIRVGQPYIWWERTDRLRCKRCWGNLGKGREGIECVRPKPEPTPGRLLKSRKPIPGQQKLF